MKIHKLKTLQPFFDDVFYNRKEFEVRKNDRDFKIGDRLQLLEVVDEGQKQRYVLKDIKYILKGGQYGIDKDFVVLGLKEVNIDGRFPLTNTIDNSIKAERAVSKMRSNLQR